MEAGAVSTSYEGTLRLANAIGQKLQGGETIELISDLGGGKTAFVRGLAEGIDSPDQVQSPTFTISRIYHGRNNLEIHHFDFHRLEEAGIIAQQLSEAVEMPQVVVAVEWSDVVKNVLPGDRLQVWIEITGEQSRTFSFKAIGVNHERLLVDLR